MRQFQVPQFITVEDTIVGPLTIKQFAYIGVGVLLIGISYKFFSWFVFILAAAVIGACAGSLAFLKINDQPLPKIMRHWIAYLAHPRLYIWKKATPVQKQAVSETARAHEVLINTIPKLSESKLSDLSWSLDIKEKTK